MINILFLLCDGKINLITMTYCCSHKTEEVKFLSKRALTMKDVERLGYEKTNDLSIIDYEDDEDLRDSDFIFVTLEFQEKEYIFIHGFPGDNPCGGFLDQNWNILITIGDGHSSYRGNIFSTWYDENTKDKYSEVFYLGEMPEDDDTPEYKRPLKIYFIGSTYDDKMKYLKSLTDVKIGSYDSQFIFASASSTNVDIKSHDNQHINATASVDDHILQIIIFPQCVFSVTGIPVVTSVNSYYDGILQFHDKNDNPISFTIPPEKHVVHVHPDCQDNPINKLIDKIVSEQKADEESKKMKKEAKIKADALRADNFLDKLEAMEVNTIVFELDKCLTSERSGDVMSNEFFELIYKHDIAFAALDVIKKASKRGFNLSVCSLSSTDCYIRNNVSKDTHKSGVDIIIPMLVHHFGREIADKIYTNNSPCKEENLNRICEHFKIKKAQCALFSYTKENLPMEGIHCFHCRFWSFMYENIDNEIL